MGSGVNLLWTTCTTYSAFKYLYNLVQGNGEMTIDRDVKLHVMGSSFTVISGE